MKKITLFTLLLFAIVKLQAQSFEIIPTNGGSNANYRSSLTVTDWLHYDNGLNDNALGHPSSNHTIGAYIKLTPSLLAGHINRQVEELKFYINDLAFTGDITINIMTAVTASPVYSQTVPHASVVQGWNTIVLTTAYQIDGTEFYIGYDFSMPAGHYGAGIDGSTRVDNANYLNWNGTWYEFGAAGLDANWNLQAGIGGAIAANDCGVSSVNYMPIIAIQNVSIEATIRNYGSNVLNSINLNYQVDGGTVYTDNLTGLNLASGQSTTITHTTPWSATPGVHNIDVYTSNFNGNGADDITANDHYTYDITVLNEIFPKNVVYEEGTGTWCGWCVRGIAGLKDMYHYHNDGSFIGIAVHNGDPMTVTEYDDRLGISSFPKGKINRMSTIDPGYSSLEPAYLADKNIPPLGKIEITNKTWDSGTRTISVDVNSTFAIDISNSNYNASLIIVEDGVTGTTSGYDQHNYYSGQYNLTDWEGTNYRNLPDPIAASNMVYDHVGRAIVGGFDGVAGSIPNSVTYNLPNAYTFTYNLPASIDEDNTHLVAVIIDNTTGEVINGYETKLIETQSVDEFFTNNNVEVYPNPTVDMLTIKGAKNMHVSIYNMLGVVLVDEKFTSDYKNISVEQLSKGIYFIRFSKDNKSGVKKLLISK